MKKVSDLTDEKRGFFCGYLVALSTLVHNCGTNTESYEMWREIGEPSAKFVRDLGLCEYDREACNQLRKETR